MTKQEETLFHEEKLAMRKYAKERRKISDDLYIHMPRIQCRDRLIGGLIFGGILGIILGGLNFGIGALKIRNLDRNDFIKTPIQYKLLQKKLVFSTTMIVDILILFILSCCIEDCRTISYDFKKLAKKLSNGYFKQIFAQEQCTKEEAKRAKRAAALIINNMPREKLEDMRILAIDGLSYGKEDYFEIDANTIEAAQKIVLEHLDAHPEIRYAVAQIMNNEKIQTYVLNGISQKTK